MLTDEQLKQRKGRITASVVPLILGSNPYGDEQTAYNRIMGLDSFTGNKATERGDLLEHVVLDYVTEVFPDLRREAGEFVSKDDWAGCTIDATYWEGNTLLFGGEGKTVGMGSASNWGEGGTNQVPDYVRHQCVWQLFCWPKLDRIYVPVLFGGNKFEFELYHVDRRDSEIESVAKLAYDWWERHIRNRMPPEPGQVIGGDSGESPGGNSIEPANASRINNLITMYRESRELLDSAKGSIDQIRALIMDNMGGEKSVDLMSAKVSRSKRGGKPKVDWKAVAQSMHAPDDLIERFTQETIATEYITVRLK